MTEDRKTVNYADGGGMKKFLNPDAAVAKNDGAAKLPFCPDGATTDQTSAGPCRKKNHHKKKKSFRIPLKKEDGNMEAQIIEYQCDFPNRVVVRLEYLMQSTKVRLNDREWMDEFYEKLLEEESRNMKKSIRGREKGEMNRMKQLIIEGIDKEIPEELSYLHRHPVFRVNQMLQRLATFDHTLVTQRDDDEEITPVEPYEYDGNKFFKHLHDTGTLWVPDEQRAHDEEKLQGKIYRAKLRLQHKRRTRTMEEKVHRIINSKELLTVIVRMDDDLDEADIPRDRKMSDTDKRDAMAAAVKLKAQVILTRIENKIKKSKDNEKDHEAVLDVKRREYEQNYVELDNHDAEILDKYERRAGRRTIDDILNDEREDLIPTEKKKGVMLPFEKVFESKSAGVGGGGSSKYSGPIFTRLTKAWGVSDNFRFDQYEDYENEFLEDYMDSSEEFQEMLDNAEEVTLLYDKQKMVMEDHIAKPMMTQIPQKMTQDHKVKPMKTRVSQK